MSAKTINLIVYALLFSVIGIVIILVLDDATADLGQLGTSFKNLFSGIGAGLGWLNPGNWFSAIANWWKTSSLNIANSSNDD